MNKVSINNLADYTKRIGARPHPSDKFTVTLTRSHLKWHQRIVAQQVKSEQMQLDHYIKRDATKHPERKTIDRFRERLEIAKDFAEELDKATRIWNA